MASAGKLARAQPQLRALVDFALGEGWCVVGATGEPMMFTKPGCASIFTHATARHDGAGLDTRTRARQAHPQEPSGTDPLLPEDGRG